MPRVRPLLLFALLAALLLAAPGAVAPAWASPAAEGSAKPVPPRYFIGQLRHSVQTLNNCGPAALSATLSYYGVYVSQEEARQVLRPYAESRGMSQNVIPPYVEDFGLRSVVRVNGNRDVIKALVANDIPVIVLQHISETWRIGHFRVVQGYDDYRGVFLVNDSLLGPNVALSYDSFDARWAYNWSRYMPVYRPDQEPLVAAILGADWTEAGNFGRALPELQAKVAEKDDDWTSWSRMVEGLTGMGRLDEALKVHDSYTARRGGSAVSPAGNPSTTSTARIKILVKQGRFQEALAAVDQTIARSGTGGWGCIVAAILDFEYGDEKMREKANKAIADSVATWIKAGLTLERVTDDEVREWFQGSPCPHEGQQSSFLESVRPRIVPVRD